MSRQNYLNTLNITEEQFEKQIRNRAEAEVKNYLIFKALEKSEASSIKPSEEEIKREKDELISQYKKEDEKIK